jgi:alditol oxidase
MTDHRQNWAGNYTYNAARWHYPTTIAEIQDLVARQRKLKVLGSRHSFNNIADTDADLISLERLVPEAHIDRERNTVTIDGGARYGRFCDQLHRAGFALHNLASLPHISVSGACATATHGSGDDNGNLATAVRGIEFVRADGEIVTLSREQDGRTFQGAVVSLGGLGVITKITLDLVPTFMVKQDVYEHLPFERFEADFDAISASAYSISLFTDWQGARFTQVWVKRRVNSDVSGADEEEFFGAQRVRRQRHPVEDEAAHQTTEQRGIPGAWHERLPHFRMEHQPSVGVELQSEYFVPRGHARAALQALYRLREQIAPHLFISEVRTIAADELWMSPCYQRDSVAFHFTWKQNWPEVRKVLPAMEAELAPFEARPHWGKLFTLPPEELRSLYPRLPDFQALLEAYDPQAKFRNAYLDRYVFGDA